MLPPATGGLKADLPENLDDPPRPKLLPNLERPTENLPEAREARALELIYGSLDLRFPPPLLRFLYLRFLYLRFLYLRL